MMWLYLTLACIAIVAVGVFVVCKFDSNEVGCTFFVIGSIGFILFITIFIVSLATDKKESKVFYYDHLKKVEQIEAYAKMVSPDNDEALKEIADTIYNYNMEVIKEQNKYTIYGNLWYFRDPIIMELPTLEYSNIIPAKTVKIIN